MRTLSILLATTAFAISTPIMAQDAAPADSETEANEYPEIVVTAQKREQNVQDVPVAITVVSADALGNVGGGQLQDLTKLSPSLTITQGGDQNNNSVILRGIGTSAFSIGVEPSVLVVVDDVATGLPGQGFNDLGDIERIEVLRGPQSTLFGKSASAGVISIVTKRPSDSFTASGEVTITDDNEQRYALGISGPLGDKLSYRVSGTVGRYDGNTRNLTTGGKLNGRDSENIRGKLLFKPSDVFDATLIGYYSKTSALCCANVVIQRTAGMTSPLGATTAATLAGITPGQDNFAVRVDPAPQSDVKNYGGSLKMNLALGEHTLTSVSALSDYFATDVLDFDGVVGPNLGAPLGAFQAGSFAATTLSQEIRLTSPSGGALQYVVGAYYAYNDYTRRFERPKPPLGNARVPWADWKGNITSETVALFGQAELSVTDSTKLLAGLRWSNEDVSYAFNRYFDRPAGPGGVTARPPFFSSGNDSDSVFTGKVGIQQDIGEDVMVFATASRGYKGQTYDLTTSFDTPTSPARFPVKPESSDNYEIGMRGAFLDRKLIFNVTGFLTNYSNFQAQTISPEFGGSLLLANVGSLRTKGIETEVSVRPFNGLTLTGNVAYVDATIKSYPNAECYFNQTVAQGCTPRTTGGNAQNIAGGSLANAPKWKYNLGADLNLPVGSLPVNFIANFNYAWQSEVNFSLSQNPRTIQDGYGIANASIGFEESENKRYKITFFARNLFNKHYFSRIQDLSSNWSTGPNPTVVSVEGIQARDSARYFGVKLGFKY